MHHRARRGARALSMLVLLSGSGAAFAADDGWHVIVGAGGLFAVNFVPDALAPLYEGHNPTAAMGFVRLKLD